MASVALIILCAATFLFMADAVSLATGPAAAPSSGKLNLTAILEKAKHFNTYINLLTSLQETSQLLNPKQQGITLLAPSDSAFAALKPGTLHSLSDQDKIALVKYHALPRYYTFGQLQAVTNPVLTLASGNAGLFGMNFSSIGNSVNVSTGIVNAAISGPVYSQNPVAVYQVDKVLLPLGVFGPKPPAPAPAEAGAPMVTPTVSPSSDGSATSGCRSRFVFSNGVALAMAVLSVGFVASL